jgi:hypothetical protein
MGWALRDCDDRVVRAMTNWLMGGGADTTAFRVTFTLTFSIFKALFSTGRQPSHRTLHGLTQTQPVRDSTHSSQSVCVPLRMER